MFQFLIAVLAISSVAILAMTSIFYGAAAFTTKSPSMASVRTARPLLTSKSGKTSVGLQLTLALLLACVVALGFVAVQ
jgi:hypothetical protein